MMRIDTTLSATRKASLEATLTITILGAGALTRIALVAVDWFISRCFTVLAELVRHITRVYVADDPSLKLLVLCLSINTLIKLDPQRR